MIIITNLLVTYTVEKRECYADVDMYVLYLINTR
jgi:hypothetical protein